MKTNHTDEQMQAAIIGMRARLIQAAEYTVNPKTGETKFVWKTQP